MADLELRHLRMLCAIADEPSLTRAAARMGVSQPALSAALQRIERRIGGRLFDRLPTGMQLTDLGAYVVGSSRIVLADMDSLTAGAAARTRKSGGELRIGACPGHIGPGLAASVTESGTADEVTLAVAGVAQLALDLECQRLDFAVLEEVAGFPLPTTDRVDTRKLVSEPVFVALPADHRLSGQPTVALSDLADEDWVVTPMRDTNDQVVLARACADAGFSPRLRHEVTEADASREMVAAGAVALAQPVSRNGEGFVIRPLTGDPIIMERWFAWNSDGPYAGYATEVYRCAASAYLRQVDRNPDYRRWWDAHPEAHRTLDAALVGTSG
jgi:DNA-binding transcriptional LysR family regulator